jgi:hypothetical protein
MKTIKLFTLLSLLPATCYLLLVLSCEQPFKAGLGPVIDLQNPTISPMFPNVPLSPEVASYIRGEVVFSGTAADDYKLDSLWFNISNYPLPEDPTEDDLINYPLPSKDYEKTIINGLTFYRITEIKDPKGDKRNFDWQFTIDTTMVDDKGKRIFPDGDFKLKLRVTDSVGKLALTDEIIYYIKNDIPEIVIDAPPIVQGKAPGDLGYDLFNYDHLGNFPGLWVEGKPPAFMRTMETEGLLVGRISDYEGIYTGPDDIVEIFDHDGNPELDEQGIQKTVKVYPPQIRFWQVDLHGSASGFSPIYEAGVIPTEAQVPWVKIGGSDGAGEFISGDGKTNMVFSYVLPDKSGQYYAFQVRAQSIDRIHSKAEYPIDYFKDFDKQSPEYKQENSYVLIRVIEPLEYPVLTQYQLQDIYGPPENRDGTLKPFRGLRGEGAVIGVMQYNRVKEDGITKQPMTDQIEDDGNHSYVDKPIVSKNGPFILRMKASHSQDIASVKVYWEKEDKSEKGRFIWDWVDPSQEPYKNASWFGIIPPKANPYYQWGLHEWDGVDNNGVPMNSSNTKVRSYVFTYRDDGTDKVPSDANSFGIGGKSKVQKIKPASEYGLDDKGNQKRLALDELPEEMSNWDEVSYLDDGTYNVYVYATSMGGTRIANPYSLTITIDREKPTIELNDIIGRASEIKENFEEPYTLVNGVIEPKFAISDSRTGSTNYFKRLTSADGMEPYYPERMFIVVKENDTKTVKKTLDEYFALGQYIDKKKNVWPVLPANLSDPMAAIDGLTVRKHGLINSSACRFKTSPIYHLEPSIVETDTLEDGVYWVYAFVRDTAFNVGGVSFPIEVKAVSDYPHFEWGTSSIKPTVTEPDSAYDLDGDEYKAPNIDKSFIITGNEMHNKLEPGASILLDLTDDDSLDLGQGPGLEKTHKDYDKYSSKIIVTFIGSQPDSNGKITALPEDTHLITLSDTEIKRAFPPQTVNNNGSRIPAKSSKGTISQTVLLNALKTNEKYNDLFGINKDDTTEAQNAKKDAFSSLPDGIYRVGITISDYQPAKLAMPADERKLNGEPVADITTVSIRNDRVIPVPTASNPLAYLGKEDYFWIAVDTKSPAVDVKYSEIEEDGLTKRSGQPFSTERPLFLVGTVSDENGPIKLVEWKVRELKTGNESKKGDEKPGIPIIIPLTDSEIDDDGLSKIPKYEQGKWNYNFHYKMTMKEGDTSQPVGAYNFEVTFRDRFGNKTTQTLTYAVDNEPPKVSLMRPIETFSRPMLDDADLKPGTYPQNSANIELNKQRLAVKTVNFSINVVDNFRVVGVRWWLLPYNVGADAAGFNPSGIVSSYDAVPSSEYAASGTYYFSKPNNYDGAYGFINKGGQLTIAIDTLRLTRPNGEYRLHIIAIDDAKLTSVAPSVILNSNVFQEVFFLQEEDRPYFGGLDNITPGTVVTGAAVTTTEWNKMDVRGGNPLIRGTIFENNGFFTGESDTIDTTFWGGSITIWFSNSNDEAAANLPTTPAADGLPSWEHLVKTDQDIPGYTRMKIPNDMPTGLGRSGRNISLAIELAKLFPTAFNTDGKKRYIIKATDSPVNKFYDGKTDINLLVNDGIPMGGPATISTTPNNQSVRESRWRQFAFVYDAKDPVVVITKPSPPNDKFGTNFANPINDPSPGFNLVGYISDMNLQTMTDYYKSLPEGHADHGKTDDNYYFEYYLNSNSANRKKFVLASGNGVTVTPGVTTDGTNTPIVNFNITPQRVAAANGIITQAEFDALSEGQHTLNIFALDKSGREGAGWVSFTKDTKPPTITFTNLEGNNRPYDSSNKSIVTKTWWTSMTTDAKRTQLLGTTSSAPLPLTTISYTTGIPELRGTITDLVSDIDLTVGPNPNFATGSINGATSSLKYWIDAAGPANERNLAIIDGDPSRSIRWTILLTDNGMLMDKPSPGAGKPLPDGVHTIVMTVKDKAGIEIPPNQANPADERYMIAFRIDSKQPTAAVTVSGASAGVYGNVAYQNDPMFILTMTAQDANLNSVELRIVRKEETGDVETDKKTFTAQTPNTPPFNATWTYTPRANATADDSVTFSGTYGVPKFAADVKDGKYEAIVTAYDTAGNKSEEFIFPFIYDKTQPKIVFTSPDDATQNGNGTPVLTPSNFIDPDNPAAIVNKINRLTSENLRITGLVIDEFSAISQVQSRVEKWNWNGANSNTWTQVEDWKDVRDLKNPDNKTPPEPNKLLQISWTKNLLGQNNTTANPNVDLDLRRNPDTGAVLPPGTLNTPANLATAEGLYRIRIRAKDSSIIAVGTQAVKDGWDFPQGQGNPIISQYVYFYFDRNNPELKITKINGADASLDTYYREPPSGGFTFEGTVKDNNRFAKVEVLFRRTGSDPLPPMTVTRTSILATPNQTDPAPTPNVGGVTQNWTAKFDSNVSKLSDGRYTVSITVYDMTGRSTREEKSFILDATKPTVKFTLPAKEPKDYKGFGDDSENPKPTPANTANGFASKMVLGGETAVITGVTEDKPDDPKNKGDESGIDQMWFRLGFIDNIQYNNTDNPFPTKTAIENDEIRLIRAFAAAATPSQILSEEQVRAMPAKVRNDWMNEIAKYRATVDTDNTRGNSWFKLGGDEKPTGFIIDNPNIYDWRFEIPNNYPATGAPPDLTQTMTALGITQVTISGVNYYPIGGLKLYGNTVRVKGRTYTVGNTAARQMVRAVDGQAGGIYRLPLWVRITDIAGNVEYYCHDIWINMNGDIPITSIESPSNGTKFNARGGAISVDGVARSNTSVYDVIFRVFADNIQNTNLDGIQTNNQPNPALKTVNGTTNTLTAGRPAANKFVRIPGYNQAEAATIAKFDNYINVLSDLNYYKSTDWQRANLTLTGGSGEPLIPWSIMLNSGEQIASKISTDGFAAGGSGPPDTIRVWLEVFVLSGEGSPSRLSIYPNDNLGTASYQYTGANGGILYGTPESAMAYVKSFYLKTGAVAITHPNVGTRNDGTAAPSAGPFTSPFRRNNVWWNAEDAQNQGNGGYGGAGTETRNDKFAFSATLDPAFGSTTSELGEVTYRVKLNDGAYSTWATAWARTQTNTDPTAANANLPTGISISRRTDTPAIGPARTRYYFDYKIDSKATTNNAAATGYIGIPVPGNNNWFSAAGVTTNWSNTGGTMTVQIRIRDNASPPNEAEQTIQVGVDNFPPIGDRDSYGNTTVAGTNVTFQGRAYDFATLPADQAMPKDSEFAPKKLKRVYAWFTKTNTSGEIRYVNMNTGVLGKIANTTTTGTPATQAMTAFSSRNATITGGGASETTPTAINITSAGSTTTPIYVPQKATGESSWNAAYVREIDQATGQPANKMLWSPVQSQNYDVKWQFTLDSTKLPDGPITLHYVVEDEAGNASYYTQPTITVKNRYPEITRLTLYTDNNGQGAAFTKDDTIEYDLNDYRAKMFYNYTDTADNQIPAGGTHRKSDTTGYLNSGFIAKNNYIGFRVETEKGNRPLSFRLQHVTRERVTLSRANLQNLLNSRNSPSNINLYTIAWHGDYSAANWKAIGVPVDKNPTLGMHFVLQPPEGSTGNTLPANYKDSTTAQVWKYTARLTEPDVRPTGAAQSEDPAETPVVLGPNTTYPGGVNFNISGAAKFNNILEKNGSRPDPGDENPDYPVDYPANNNDSVNGTAFFLIRVWDSVGKPAPTIPGTNTEAYETWVNGQLHDALVVGMNVYKRDNIKPVARLYDLNPYTEAAIASSGNKNDTITNAAHPGYGDAQNIGSNIVRGGLYNDGTTREPVKSGFINPRGGSKALNRNLGTEAAPVNELVNGIYDHNGKLINGLPLPDYPLKIKSDTAPTGTGADQVSGKIILRGIAWDDQLIDTISLSLNGTSRTILQLNSAGKMAAAAGYENSAFAVETLHWKTGHTVEWAYVWDASAINPGTSVPILVTVKDKKGSNVAPPTAPPATPPGLTSDNVPVGSETASKFHNSVSVNVVPYITGFERHKPQFTTKRSLQGWYSFYQGEGTEGTNPNRIKVIGYNFGTGTVTMNLGSTVLTVTGNSATQREFSIPETGATSGAITMMVGTTPAYNNGVDVASATADTASKSWNREYSSFTPGSDLWVNKPYAHIWRSNEAAGSSGNAGTIIGASNTSEGMDSPTGRATPSMALQYTQSGNNTIGTLHAAWSKYNRDEVYYGTNTGGAQRLLRAGEPYTQTDIDFYNGSGINTNDRYNSSVVVSYQRDGGPRLVLKATIQDRDVSGGDDNSWVVGAGVNGSNPASTSSDRWKNPRIRKLAVSGNGTTNVTTPTQALDNNPGTVIISAFDSYDNRLHYSRHSGTLTNTTGGSYGDRATQFFLDGGGVVDQGNATAGSMGAIPIIAGSVNNSNTGGTIARSNNAGKYSAIDYDSNSRPVIAYFDDANQTLRLLYANSDNPTAGNAWTRRYVLPVGHALRLGSGSFVSMKIQRQNEAGGGTAAQGDSDRIHLAFYNSNQKAIVYAVGTRAGTFEACVVDRVVEGGQWTDIALDQDSNPWITYADSTRTGNRDGVRIAYKSYSGSGTAPAGAFSRPLTDPVSGVSIRGWEAMTMPANYEVNNDRLNIAAWPPKNAGTSLAANCPLGSWNAAVGYSGSDKFRIGYFFKPATTVMNNSGF